MKKKLLKMTLAALSLCIFTNIVKADGLLNSFDFANVGETLLTCEYRDTTKHELRVEIYINSDSQKMNIKGWKDGQIIEGDNLFPSDRDGRGKNAIIGGEKYMQYTGRCPKYAGYYTKGNNGYVFANDDKELKKADYIVRLKEETPNPDYCHYSFQDLNNIDLTELEYGWGFWYKKNIGKAFSNGYTASSECPAYVVTELGITPFVINENISTDTSRKMYGTDEGISLTVTQQLCAKEAGDLIGNSTYGEEEDYKDIKCYTAQPTTYEDAPDEGGSGEQIPTELNCDGLFDAETKKAITNAYFIIEVVAILIVIGLTIKDYAFAILNSNQDEIKKSHKRLLTRLIVLTIILLLPALVNLLLKIFKIEMFSSDPLCGTIRK